MTLTATSPVEGQQSGRLTVEVSPYLPRNSSGASGTLRCGNPIRREASDPRDSSTIEEPGLSVLERRGPSWAQQRRALPLIQSCGGPFGASACHSPQPSTRDQG